MQLLAKPVSVVWLALMVITVVSTWVLTGEGVPAHVAALSIMVLAAAKVAAVMWRFMDLREAPRPWQAIYGLWLVGITVLILVFYAVSM